MPTTEKVWEIKVASRKDWDRWMGLAKMMQADFHGIDLYNDQNYRSHIDRNIQRSTAIYVEDKATHELLGAMTYSPRSLQIGWLGVAPSHRRKGIGTALVEYMFAALPKGVPLRVKTFLESDASGMVAHEFYRSLGFSPKEILEDVDNVNAGHPFQLFVRE